MFTVTMKVAWQPFLCFYLSKPFNLRLIAYLTNMTSIHITTMLPMIPLLHFRSPTLPTWPALLAAKRLSTLPPSWASQCHSVSLFKIIAVKKAILCHIATFTLPPSRCHSVSQSSKLFSKPFGMKKVIQWQLLSLSPLSLFTLITFTFTSIQRWCPSLCQWSPCANHLWGLHLAHRQLQQLLHEQLHTSGEDNQSLKLQYNPLFSSTTTWLEVARPTRSNWSFFPTGCKRTNFFGGRQEGATDQEIFL